MSEQRKGMENLVYPDAVFFDWDGTLVDSIAFLTKAHNAVKAELGLEAFKEGEFDQYFGVPREVLFREIYGDFAAQGKAGFERYYHANHLTEMVVKDGAVKLLETIQSLGIPMGVVSNKKNDFLQLEVDYLGWRRFFGDAVIGSGVAPSDKPDPAPLIFGISFYDNIQVERVWYVGDTEVDVECSRSAGCPCILVAPLEIEMGNGVWEKKYEDLCGFLLQSV